MTGCRVGTTDARAQDIHPGVEPRPLVLVQAHQTTIPPRNACGIGVLAMYGTWVWRGECRDRHASGDGTIEWHAIDISPRDGRYHFLHYRDEVVDSRRGWTVKEGLFVALPEVIDRKSHVTMEGSCDGPLGILCRCRCRPRLGVSLCGAVLHAEVCFSGYMPGSSRIWSLVFFRRWARSGNTEWSRPTGWMVRYDFKPPSERPSRQRSKTCVDSSVTCRQTPSRIACRQSTRFSNG